MIQILTNQLMGLNNCTNMVLYFGFESWIQIHYKSMASNLFEKSEKWIQIHFNLNRGQSSMTIRLTCKYNLVNENKK